MNFFYGNLFSNRFFGGLIFAFIFLGLVFAGLAGLGLYLGTDVEYRLRWGHGFALLSLLAAYSIAMVTWHTQLHWLGIRATWNASFADIAFLSVGKYLPGKVLGILVRGYRAESVRWDKHVALQSFFDQMILLATGLTLAALCWLSLSLNLSAQLFSLALIVGLFFLVFSFVAVGTFSKQMANPPIAIALFALTLTSFRKTVFLVTMATMCWLFTTLAIFPFLDVDLWSPDALYLGSAFLVSFLIGWLVLFMPAGAAVREGSFVLLTAPVLDYDEAIVAILSFRLVGVFLDISLGVVALLGRLSILTRYRQ